MWSDSVRSQAEIAPVTGDWVELAGSGGEDGLGTIARVLSRRTALSRRDPAERGGAQVLAANMDVVGIVAGLDRPLPPGRFERLLVMALDSGASILVLLTKADRSRRAAISADTVRAIVGDVPVILTSALTGAGLDIVCSHLGGGRTLALIGTSGSGKSSLLNAMADADVAATGPVRPKDARGRHTTIARQLVLLPGEVGLVIDTPGIRTLGLWDCEDALSRVYNDIEEASAGCRFSDCRHAAEPQCAVRNAIARGDISRRKLERARALRCELDKQRNRSERGGGRYSSRRHF